MSSLKDDLDIWKHRCDFIQGQTLAILKHSYPITSDSHKRFSLSLSSSLNLCNSTLLPISQTIWLDVVISLYRLTKDLQSLSKQINLRSIYEMQKYNTITHKHISNQQNTGEKGLTFLIPFLLIITVMTTILMVVTLC